MAVEKVFEALAEIIPTEPEQVAQKFETLRETHDVLVARKKSCRYTYEYPKDPENIIDTTPVLIVPGYGGIKPAYRKLREAIVQQGRPAITLRPIRDLGILSAFDLDHMLHPEKLPSLTVHRVIHDMQQKHEVKQFDLVGHSMGGFISSEVAKLFPEDVRSLTLVASVGIEDHNTATFVPRVLGFLKHEFVPNLSTLREENEAKLAVEALHYIFRNPFRTALEAAALTNCNIRDDLRRAQVDHGIPVGILLFEGDQLISYLQNADHARFVTEKVITHPSPEANHMWPQLAAESVGSIVVSSLL